MYSIGIVLKIKGKKSIIATEDGTFIEINTREGMFLGQKIIYSQQEIIQKRKNDLSHALPAIASIAALFILMFSYFKFFYLGAPFAYVDIDINPSMEFAVDNKGIVISEQPLNDEAENLMTGVTYEGKHIENAIVDLIKRSKEHGYLNDDGEKDIILISAAIANRKEVNDNDYRITKEIIYNLRADLARLNQNIDMRFVEVSADLRKRASKSKLSMGRYLIYEKALQEGKHISLDTISLASLEDLLKENGLGLYGVIEPINTFKPLPSDGFNESTPAGEDENTTPTENTNLNPTPTEKISLTTTPTKEYEYTPTATAKYEPTSTKKHDPTPTTTKKHESTPTPTKKHDLTPTATKKHESTPTPTKKHELTPTATNKHESTPTPTNKINTTSTKKNESTPKATKEYGPTPTVTKILKPTATQASVGKHEIKVQFYSNNEVTPTTWIFLRIRVENTGSTALNLSDLKLRYYYTVDGYSDQVFICDWASVGAHNVTGRFEMMSSPRPGADTFLEIGFGKNSGVLEPGRSVDMNIRYSKSDQTEYNQEDDYSFRATKYVFEDWDRITAYVSGVLRWGKEP